MEHANQTLNPIFDKEKEQNRIREAQLIAQIGSQAGDIARTEGQIRATNAGKAELEKKGVKAPDANAPKKAWEAYNSQLAATESYKAVQKQWGTGSAIQQGIQAATAAVQGLAGGNMAQAVSGAAAPYLAEVIHDMTTTKGPDGKEVVNVEANLMAHAVVGAVTSYAAGNSALAGASGAVMGEYIAQQLYPGVERKALTEEQRQTISALGTLAAGLAGGLTGDSTADAVAGAQAGKKAVENNALLAPAPVPVPVPGVPVSPGDKVKQDANDKMASALDDLLDTLDKATQCSFGRACSTDDTEQPAGPNAGANLTDAEKAEYGGVGSGMPGGWEPQDEENARDNTSPSDPKNRAQHEEYVDSLRASMEKPYVKDEILRNLINDLYRPNAKVGSGSTADAVRYELATGEKVGGKGHVEKAQAYSKALQDWLSKNPQASQADRSAAENVLKDMQNALKGK